MASGLANFDVYRVSREFNASVAKLSAVAPTFARDQLDRAAASILQNVAEGAGRRSLQDQRRFYGMAYGSANECAAILDIMRIRQSADAQLLADADALLGRIIRMLVKLTNSRARNEDGNANEHEHEHENGNENGSGNVQTKTESETPKRKRKRPNGNDQTETPTETPREAERK